MWDHLLQIEFDVFLFEGNKLHKDLFRSSLYVFLYSFYPFIRVSDDVPLFEILVPSFALEVVFSVVVGVLPRDL